MIVENINDAIFNITSLISKIVCFGDVFKMGLLFNRKIKLPLKMVLLKRTNFYF